MKIKFISVSGIDGSGKSTQLELIKQYFEKNKKPVVYLWTRGGSTPGINSLKSFIRILAGKKLPPSGNSVKRDQMLNRSWIQRIWLILAILDLLRIYSLSIRWWLFRGKVVICDRYLWDTLIDFTIMFPKVNVKDWYIRKQIVNLSPIPDRAALLIIPLALSEKRCSEKYDPFPDTPENRKLRYEQYQSFANLSHWSVIDATRSEDVVFRDIMFNIDLPSVEGN